MKSFKFIFVFILFVSALSAQLKGVAPVSGNSSLRSSSSTYAVVIGISDYQDPAIPDLRFADKDAEAFANYLRSEAGGKLDNDHLKVLINSNATQAQFAMALDWLWEVCKEGDQAIIYFSGHGDVEKKSLTQPGYLLCWDAPSRVYMVGGAFKLADLQEVISTLSIQNKAKVIVITDACRSGTLAGSSVGGAQATAANLAKQFGNEIKIMSCQPNEYSIEGEQWGGGRGAFSYHLVNGLYGMADQNGDKSIQLFEIARYLEDRVPSEVSPVAQMPLVVGDRYEKISRVDSVLLAMVLKRIDNKLLYISSIQSKGIEESVLATVDSVTQWEYRQFNAALEDGRFLEPSVNSAEHYFHHLINNPKLEKLHSTLRRNYASKLLDENQQYLNALLKADVKIIECQGFKKFIPKSKFLLRASELLGRNHYMFNTIKARELLCLGMEYYYKRTNEDAARALAKFYESIQWDPSFPVSYYFLEKTFLSLDQIDSAQHYMNICNSLAPTWIIPYTAFAETLLPYNEFDSLVAIVLEKATEIDSTHPHIYQYKAWKMLKEDKLEDALVYLNNYKTNGGETYACWYAVLGTIYQRMTDSSAKAAECFLKAISMDSTRSILYFNLGVVEMQLNNWQEAERNYKKAIQMDSTRQGYKLYLGEVYMNLGKYNEAEKAILESYPFSKDNYQDAIFLLSLGIIFKRPAQVDSMIRFLENSQQFPMTVQIKRAQWAFREHKYEEAHQLFLDVIAKRPNSLVTNLYLSYFSWKNTELDKAKIYFEKYLSLRKNKTSLESQYEFVPVCEDRNYNNFKKWLMENFQEF